MAEDLVKPTDALTLLDSLLTLGSSADGAVERDLRSTIEQQAASLAAKDKEIERLRAKCFALERAKAREWFCNQLGEIGFIGIRDYAALQSRAEQAERVFTDICEELGCKPDNEAALEAVAALKRALAEAVEVMRLVDHVRGTSDDTPVVADTVRTFVAQHGSDSREGK